MAAKKPVDFHKRFISATNIPWKGTEEAPRFYTNSVQIRMSTHDFIFRIGEVIEDGVGGFFTKEVARVAMSPSHAKQVALLLDAYIEDYEKEHGPLPEPQGPPGNE